MFRVIHGSVPRALVLYLVVLSDRIIILFDLVGVRVSLLIVSFVLLACHLHMCSFQGLKLLFNGSNVILFMRVLRALEIHLAVLHAVQAAFYLTDIRINGVRTSLILCIRFKDIRRQIVDGLLF